MNEKENILGSSKYVFREISEKTKGVIDITEELFPPLDKGSVIL